jgi:hypothetical protein
MRAFLVAGFLLLSSVASAAPQELTNDTYVIKPRSEQSISFTLSRPAKVLLDVTGLKNTAKGFRVEVSGHGNEITKAFHRVVDFGPGDHRIVVTNTENLLERATVHVRVVVDPNE